MAMLEIRKAQQRGARTIVIDHRRTETVRNTGAHWIGVRPGTDGALVLSILKVVIEMGIYDRYFTEKWTVGFT